MRKTRTLVMLAGAFVASVGLSGCYPLGMGLLTPIPVFPWVTERMEDKFVHKNDHRTSILPPIREGYPPPMCEDPPDEATVLRAMPRVARGIPYFYEEFRDNIQIVTERVVDRIDPCRFYPVVGPAQLHHCHWKCTIYYTETIESGYPFPFKSVKQRVEVVYIDKDHLHLCSGTNPQVQQTFARETSSY